MQRRKPTFRLVDPKESSVYAALMHYTIEIVLQSKEIEGVSVEIVNVIVVHAWALQLETHCPANLAILSVHNHPLIFDISQQPIFRG
jgi:hypothetical protein